jgi:hypothetical protein
MGWKVPNSSRLAVVGFAVLPIGFPAIRAAGSERERDPPARTTGGRSVIPRMVDVTAAATIAAH